MDRLFSRALVARAARRFAISSAKGSTIQLDVRIGRKIPNSAMTAHNTINTEVAIRQLGYGEYFVTQIGFALDVGA